MIAAAASCGLPNHLFRCHARANPMLVPADPNESVSVTPGHPHDSSLGRRHGVRATNKIKRDATCASENGDPSLLIRVKKTRLGDWEQRTGQRSSQW
jgi:hypothetical protein